MNNFAVPSVFEAWIDQIRRVGRTIGMLATGEKMGLLQDKPVYIGIASGGSFAGSCANQPDFLTPCLIAGLMAQHAPVGGRREGKTPAPRRRKAPGAAR